VVNVRDKVKEIVMEDLPISHVSFLHMMDNYLMIRDYHQLDKCIHLFDKNTFRYLTSIVDRGEGPNEITRCGHVATDEINRRFFVTDQGKQKIFSYNLDSAMASPNYHPTVKTELRMERFPKDYQYMNDTLCIGVIWEPIGNADYTPHVGKWNMKTGEIQLMNYENPGVVKRRIHFAMSPEHGMYVECHEYHDLMTVCSLDGELKYNIYGPRWENVTSPDHYYSTCAFCGDRIVALYSGGNRFKNKEEREINWPTKFHVFDLNGEYMQTLETGYYVIGFCYDQDNRRIIMHLDDEIQFAYLDLEGIIK
jgi:hypothetical protein